MAAFTGFTAADFAVFAIPTLEGRMEGIRIGPRPRLEALGCDLAPFLSELVGCDMYPIVARHARRKVNPPADTWVAWSANKRGYKMMPHFQVGLWESHAFVQAGVIYEASARARFAENLLANLPALRKALPTHYRWLEDYTRPQGIAHGEMTDAEFRRLADRLRHRRQADCMVGLAIARDEAVKLGPALAEVASGVMQTLLPVYALAG